MKAITIAGNIGKDAVTRRTQSGDAVTGFSVGVTERGKEKRTYWFDVSIWGKRGETLAQYLTKGSKVVVTGELTTREHDGKTYLGVTANDITLMGGAQKDEGGKYPGPNDNVPMPHGLGGPSLGDFEDSIPFDY